MRLDTSAFQLFPTQPFQNYPSSRNIARTLCSRNSFFAHFSLRQLPRLRELRFEHQVVLRLCSKVLRFHFSAISRTRVPAIMRPRTPGLPQLQVPAIPHCRMVRLSCTGPQKLLFPCIASRASRALCASQTRSVSHSSRASHCFTLFVRLTVPEFPERTALLTFSKVPKVPVLGTLRGLFSLILHLTHLGLPVITVLSVFHTLLTIPTLSELFRTCSDAHTLALLGHFALRAFCTLPVVFAIPEFLALATFSTLPALPAFLTLHALSCHLRLARTRTTCTFQAPPILHAFLFPYFCAFALLRF